MDSIVLETVEFSKYLKNVSKGCKEKEKGKGK